MGIKDIFVILKNKEIKVKEGSKYENDEFCIIANQKLYNIEQKEIKLNEIIDLYKKNIELSNIISNTFSILIIDKNENTLSCIQDINGDTVPIYYYRINSEIIFTNKLRNIINYKNTSFYINKKIIKLFINKGVIPNKQTLIKDIFKLIPKYNLIINLKNKKEKFKKKKIKYKKIKKCSTDLYIKEFEKIIEINQKNKNIFSTLSNGYDSNFIFSFLNQNKNIEVFSVGGISGTNETIQVAQNIKNYENVRLNVSYVTEETLENYIDLVCCLEGAIYEKGIFLQYQLINSIKDKINDNTVIFFGEGADQIFSWEYFNKSIWILRIMKIILKSILKLFSFKNDKCSTITLNNKNNQLSNIIIKKNGILMNDINATAVYPYLMKQILDIAYSKRYVNYKEKKFHKQACSKKINSEILKNISKIGGTTDTIALFESCPYIKEIESFVNKSKFNVKKVKKDVTSNVYREYLLKVLYLDIFEFLFIEHIQEIDDKKNLKLSEFLKIKYD